MACLNVVIIVAVAVVVGLFGVVDILLGVATFVGRNWARLMLMLYSVFATTTAFVSSVTGVEVIGLAQLPTIAGGTLVLLALSSHRAREFAVRGRHQAKALGDQGPRRDHALIVPGQPGPALAVALRPAARPGCHVLVAGRAPAGAPAGRRGAAGDHPAGRGRAGDHRRARPPGLVDPVRRLHARRRHDHLVPPDRGPAGLAVGRCGHRLGGAAHARRDLRLRRGALHGRSRWCRWPGSSSGVG